MLAARDLLPGKQLLYKSLRIFAVFEITHFGLRESKPRPTKSGIIRSAPACTNLALTPLLATPIQRNPADVAASTPAAASSNARPSCGGMPIRSHANL